VWKKFIQGEEGREIKGKREKSYAVQISLRLQPTGCLAVQLRSRIDCTVKNRAFDVIFASGF